MLAYDISTINEDLNVLWNNTLFGCFLQGRGTQRFLMQWSNHQEDILSHLLTQFTNVTITIWL